MDESRHYIASDIHMLLDIIKNEIAFLKTNWKELGRPVLVLPIRINILAGDAGLSPSLLTISLCQFDSSSFTDNNFVLLL